ncbi:MAG: hypothetical protein JWN69_2102, partial [Alphaproteobacteria bacterium]|nr:hypothetical protein [Alphaproteobacteria bacterium]
RYFESWLGMVDLAGHLDQGSFNTLPMVWATLSAKSYQHSVMPRLNGIFRNNWVRAARRMAATEGMLKVLRAESISTMLVKGLPLSLTYYDRPALRPMNDIDIVVPVDCAMAASRALVRAGFAAPNANWDVDLVLRHALQHNHPDKGEADLHWHVLFECPRRSCDDHFWNSALPLQVGKQATLQPCPTDLLIHVIVHGIRWNPFPPMRWIIDAAMILRSDKPTDWDRLTSFAHANHLGKRLALGLSLLKSDFELPIPAEVVTKLAAKGSLIERVELLGMRGRDERSSWRHVRRATFVLRLLRAGRVRSLPSALAGEVLLRSRKYLSPRRKASGHAV